MGIPVSCWSRRGTTCSWSPLWAVLRAGPPGGFDEGL